MSRNLRMNVVQQGIRTALQKIDANHQTVQLRTQALTGLDTRISTLNQVIHAMLDWRISKRTSIKCHVRPETRFGTRYLTCTIKNDTQRVLSNWTGIF
jgi:hypothetical protein